ncbi:GNAT family N-acetyltransferase [Erythrobacter jejuensis]|uniref:GNAT family N-acetyltransferase n=2 Tax=Parerythrobacter jejuensis TaxID=795812 RepID=A0A845AZG4_9SPHN|nr:GNAT family N-acetyltransferase [Parerythrobacter jejuensis]
MRSKAVWRYDSAFMELCRPELTATPEQLDAHYWRCAIVDGAIIGVVELVVHQDTATLEKLFVDPNDMVSGVGRQLMCMAQRHAIASGASKIEIDADPGAVPFYEKLGAHCTGEVESESIPGRMLPKLILNLA